MAVVVKTVLVDPILVGIGEFTTHLRIPILVLGLGPVHHGHMLDTSTRVPPQWLPLPAGPACR